MSFQNIDKYFNDDHFRGVLEAGIRDFGEEMVYVLTQELLKADKKATGSLIKSLRAEYREIGESLSYSIGLISNDYLKYVDSGRKKGSYPPIKAIKQWVKVRGINISPYAIQKSIYKKGIKPTNVLKKTRDKMDIYSLETGMKDYIQGVVMVYLKENLKV